jgi:hypothetical protein
MVQGCDLGRREKEMKAGVHRTWYKQLPMNCEPGSLEQLHPNKKEGRHEIRVY